MHCTADVTLASPINKSTFGFDQNYLRGFDINGDVLGVIGAPNNFPHIDTDTSLAVAARVANDRGLVSSAFEKISGGAHIHGVDYNYLTWPASVESVESMLAQLDDECTVGSVQVPPTFTVAVGDSTPLNMAVMSRAGHPLVGRLWNVTSLHSAESESTTPYLLATAPTVTPDTVSIEFIATDQIFGTTALSVPSVLFAGTKVEQLGSEWIASSSEADNGDGTIVPIIPPPPSSPPPPWDGNPGTCTDSIEQVGFHAFQWWREQCGRNDFLNFPVGLVPVPALYRVLTADYPSGPFSEVGPWLPVPSHDSVSVFLGSCGPGYCLRAAVLQFENLNGILISSDTLCFSDQCGGSSSNRMPSRPKMAAPTTRVQRGNPIAPPKAATPAPAAARKPPTRPR